VNVVGLDLSLTATGVATEAGTEVLRTDLRGCDRLAWLRDAVMAHCTPVDNGLVFPDWEMEATLVVLETRRTPMADQTVPSLTDRLAAYMVEAFLDGRGYDPGDKIDVEVTLKEGFHTVLTEMREDQAAGTATYDGLLPSPPPGEPESEKP